MKGLVMDSPEKNRVLPLLLQHETVKVKPKQALSLKMKDTASAFCSSVRSMGSVGLLPLWPAVVEQNTALLFCGSSEKTSFCNWLYSERTYEPTNPFELMHS